jgi:ornithine cyclodeaminase/alanine dehydrogenase-like protein (mu-crystallin family)
MSIGEILYLSNEDVVAVGLEMRAVIQALEGMFGEKGAGRVEMPPKPGIHTRPDAFIHAMPAYIPALESAGLKWVSGYPQNQKRGLPYITGLLILNDPETGLPLAIMDCVWITAQRTGAATGVAAKHLARRDSSTVGILGCGVQGRSNLEALDVLFSLREVRAYDTDRKAAQAYAAHVRNRFELKVKVVDEPRKAVSGCDIVVTAGPILKQPHATIQPGWLEAGAFASLVDFDSYFSSAAMHEADKFCTDDRAQLAHYRAEGYFQDIPPVHADLGELAVGARPGRANPEEITMAANLGLALDDMAVAPLIYRAAKDGGLGTWLPL